MVAEACPRQEDVGNADVCQGELPREMVAEACPQQEDVGNAGVYQGELPREMVAESCPRQEDVGNAAWPQGVYQGELPREMVAEACPRQEDVGNAAWPQGYEAMDPAAAYYPSDTYPTDMSSQAFDYNSQALDWERPPLAQDREEMSEQLASTLRRVGFDEDPSPLASEQVAGALSGAVVRDATPSPTREWQPSAPAGTALARTAAAGTKVAKKLNNMKKQKLPGDHQMRMNPLPTVDSFDPPVQRAPQAIEASSWCCWCNCARLKMG
ncbi:unnamed protein product [Symbiodinium natans]|uniref:Uncharacterized protein n=1 Tax=Symbiodinium natans TaxID=878477 RepID=A0A812QUP9_9DINO|nr:unnamed protein product [Symbiodinium natans]